MSGTIDRIKNKVDIWYKMRQLRKGMAKARRDLDFWMACHSPSGDPVAVAMIERNQAEARSRIVTI